MIKFRFFKVPENPSELKQAWICGLHREVTHDLKAVNVCEAFREEVIELFHQVPKRDGTFTQADKPKLKEGAVQGFLPGCPHTIYQLQKQNGVACNLTQKKKN